jgi:O-antigen/teichoic acid export membrane protein
LLLTRALQALGYSAFLAVALQALALVRSIALARILDPESFGLFGIATAAYAGLAALTYVGIKQAIIVSEFAEPEQRRRWLNTTWGIQLARNHTMGLGLIAFSPLIARFYEDDRLTAVVSVVGLSVALRGFHNIAVMFREKDLDLKTIMKLEATTAILSTVATVLLALKMQTVMAMAWGFVAEAVLAVIFSYIIIRERPRLQMDWAIVRRVMHFGKHVFLATLMVFVMTQLDNLFLGKLANAQTLGYYVLAYTVATIPVTVATQVISRVLLPVYSNFGERNLEGMGPYWRAAWTVTPLLLLAMALPLSLYATDLIVWIYGSGWGPAGPILALLGWMGLFRAWAQVSSPIFLAINRPYLESSSQIVETILFVPLLWFMIAHYQAMGAALAGTLVFGGSFVARTLIAMKVLRQSFWSTVIPVLRDAGLLGLVTAVLYSVGSMLAIGPVAMAFVVGGGVLSGAIILASRSVTALRTQRN